MLETMQSMVLHVRGKPNSSAELFDVCKRLGDISALSPPTKWYPVECRKSTIHDNGLFATQHIKKGSVITQYRCDMVAIDRKDHDRMVLCESQYQQDRFSMDYAIMILCNSPNNTTYIVSDPDKPFHKAIAAHLINDPYPNVKAINTIKNADAKTLANAWLEYELRVQHCRNCELHSGLYYACAIAVKDIAPGEEILAPYGFEYWYNGNRYDVYSKAFEYISTLSSKQQKYYNDVLEKRVNESILLRSNIQNL